MTRCLGYRNNKSIIDKTKITEYEVRQVQLNGAQIVIKALQEQGVDTIFGYPGGAVLEIYDALKESDIHHVLVRNEQGGAHAALFSKGLISSKSQITYQCATASCAYFRLTDGSRCVAYKNGEYWTADRVDSDIAAKNYFMERTGTDYTFIILDD